MKNFKCLSNSLNQSLSSLYDISSFTNKYPQLNLNDTLAESSFDLLNSISKDEFISLSKNSHIFDNNKTLKFFFDKSLNSFSFDFQSNQFIYYQPYNFHPLEDLGLNIPYDSKIKLNILTKNKDIVHFISSSLLYSSYKKTANSFFNSENCCFFNDKLNHYVNFSSKCFSKEFINVMKDIFDNYSIYSNHPRVGEEKIKSTINSLVDKELSLDSYQKIASSFSNFTIITNLKN